MNRVDMTKLLTTLSCIVFLFSFSACDSTRGGIRIDSGPEVKGGPPPHAPAHGARAKYTYNYYPSAQLYFDISRKVYFYLEKGQMFDNLSNSQFL